MHLRYQPALIRMIDGEALHHQPIADLGLHRKYSFQPPSH
jgi:hypothetical protein